MTQQSNNAQPVVNKRSAQTVSRVKMLLILGAFAFPLLLATIWLQVVKYQGGELGVSARGELIRPAVPLSEFALSEQQGSTFTQETLQGIWTLFYAPVGDCGDICQRNIYHMRQVRLSLNHRMDRVQRVVLMESANQLSVELINEHPGLKVLAG